MKSKKQRKRSRLWISVLSIAVVIIVSYILISTSVSSNPPKVGTNIGDLAPNIKLFLTNGQTLNLSDFGGQNILLWFVATWCYSCQVGAQMLLSKYYDYLHQKGYIIIVVELYDDLGQPGPSIEQFAQQFGGGTGKPGWYYANSTLDATLTYDPKGYLDIFYIIDKYGIIKYVGYNLPASLPNIIQNL